MSEQVTIYIQEKRIEAQKGANLLKVARDNGFDIPGLCFHEKLTPSGACRLCMVRVDGRPTPACNVEISDGLEVVAFDDELEAWRRRVMDLLFAEHDCSCIDCNAAGNCELQDLAYRYGLIGLSGERFKDIYQDTAFKFKRFPGRDLIKEEPEENQSYFSRKNSYNGTPQDCIRCGFCVEACTMDLYPVLMMEAQTQNNEQQMEKYSPEDCITCGMCSYVCPAKIRLPKYFKGAENEEVNQHS